MGLKNEDRDLASTANSALLPSVCTYFCEIALSAKTAIKHGNKLNLEPDL